MEAVAGYKDFTMSSRFYSEELLEELGPAEDLLDSSTKSQSRVANTSNGVDDLNGAKTALPSAVLTSEEYERNGDPSEKEPAEDDEDLNDAVMDGSHILLEGLHDGNHEENEEEEEEVEADEDTGSHSSDEAVAALYNFDKRNMSAKDRDSLVSGSVSSADQHSIHSISMLMQENREGSPKTHEDLGSAAGIDYATGDGYPEGDANLENYRNKRGSTISRDSTQISDSEVQSSSTNKGDFLQHVNELAETSNLKSDSHGAFPTTNQENDSQSKKSSSQQNQAASSSGEGCIDEEDSSNETITSTDGASEYQSDEQSDRRPRTSSDMVRSETEDLMLSLSANASSYASGSGGEGGDTGNAGLILNIRDIAADSVKWLCLKLGPALASKFLTRNLVRMIALCYLGQEQMQLLDRSGGCF